MFYFKLKTMKFLNMKLVLILKRLKKLQEELVIDRSIEKSYKYTTYRIPHKNKDKEYKKFDCQKMG